MGILGKREGAQENLVRKEEMQRKAGEEGRKRSFYVKPTLSLTPWGVLTCVAPRSVCHWLKAAPRDKSIHETGSQTWTTDWGLPTERGLSEGRSGKEVGRCKLYIQDG